MQTKFIATTHDTGKRAAGGKLIESRITPYDEEKYTDTEDAIFNEVEPEALEDLVGVYDSWLAASRALADTQWWVKLPCPWAVGDEVTANDPEIRTYDNGHIVELLEGVHASGDPILVVEWHKWGRAHRDQLRAFIYPPRYHAAPDTPLLKVSPD